MRVGDVIAEIMKRERVSVLFVYPLTALTEYADHPHARRADAAVDPD